MAGDCGSLVYLIDKENSNHVTILGLLFGHLKDFPDIYQAAVVPWAMTQIENYPEFMLRDLKLYAYNAAKDSFDSGYDSSTAASTSELNLRTTSV